jgi:hypothetical protein
MITFSHELAQASRGWFIQASEASGHLSEARLPADIESDVLRAKALDAASAAVSPR